MLLTITTTQPPATDLGYLLHKHPARCQTFDLPFGKVHIFYPQATNECCTAALLLDIDPRYLTQRHDSSDSSPLEPYINDRPYVASSFMSVAIAHVFGTAMAGHCRQRPHLVTTRLPLHIKISALPCRDGKDMLHRLFEPLGYTIKVYQHVLDDHFPQWGLSPYFTVRLQATMRLQDALAHLYVLIPVLDDQKHYWVGEAEIEKLLHQGRDWLATHPERNMITNRYLKHQQSLTYSALARLHDEDLPNREAIERQYETEEAMLETPLRLRDQRLHAVVQILAKHGVRRVLDLGCGEGALLKILLEDQQFTDIVGMDVSYRNIERAYRRLHLDRLSPKQRERVTLFQGSLLYRDKRLVGFDGAALVEVIEHLEIEHLATLERTLFIEACPHVIVITTPNAEYNVRFPTLSAGTFRHKDHRFEWDRATFQKWATQVAQKCGYRVSFFAIGPEDSEVGAPTQMGVFDR